MKGITPGTHTIDATHTNVEFAVKHLMISTVKGRFGDVSGTVTVPATGEPVVDVTINAASIDTRMDARDNHLRSADFFDVEKYPTLRFVSKKATPTDDGYTLVGDLTIKDVTRPVTLTVSEEGSAVDPWGNSKSGFSATGKINRNDFGLTWNAALETGGVLVGEDVKLSFDVELTAQKAQAAA
jgi:polyisoprenoid-binding protein YceI